MKKTILSGLVAILAVATILLLPQSGSLTQAASTIAPITVDVACDGRTLVINQQSPGASQVHRGDTYVLNGVIFPGGTIPLGGTKSAPSSIGPDSAGAIGQWYAHGTYLVDGVSLATEKLQRISTQFFALQGKDRIITEGFEGSVDTNRVIVGGVNTFAGARGIAVMQRLGINSTGAYNLRFTIQTQ